MREKNLVRRRYCKDEVIVPGFCFSRLGKEREEQRERSGGTEDGGKRRNERLRGLLHGSEGMKEEIS